MADLTKTFNTGSSKGVSAQVTVTSTMDVQTNTSLVSVAVALKSTSYLGQYYLDGTIKGDTNNTLATMSSSGGTHFVTIGAKNTPYAIQGSGGAKGSPWSFTATHDNDGTKTITVSVSIKGYNVAGSGGANGFSISGSFSVVLPQIPRASTIGATDANIGSTSMVSVSRKSTSYTHSVNYEFGGLSGYLTADGGISTEEVKMDASSIAFNIPTTFYEQIPNAKSAPCTLTCRTYSDETQIGEDQTATFTITAAESLCSPQVSGTVEDINPLTLSLTGNKSKLVRYVSNALCTISATARNSATIATKSIGGQAIDGDTSTIEKVAVSSVDFRATDSRGYSQAVAVAVDLIPYIPLTCVASGRRTNPTDGNAVISVKGNYFNDTFGSVDNSLKVEYCIDGGAWAEVTPSVSGNSYTASANVSGLDYTKSFTFTVRATDKIGSVVQTVIIGKGIPIFDWGENDFRFHVPVYGAGGQGFVPSDRTINGFPLSKNITLNANAVGAAPTGYGLGESSKYIGTSAELDALVVNCNYLYAGGNHSNNIAIDGYNIAYGYGRVDNYNGTAARQTLVPLVPRIDTTLVRYFVDGGWLPWEWLNPPMVANEEYRTTERYLGKVVYTKLVQFGALPNKTEKSVTAMPAGASLIDAIGIGYGSSYNVAIPGYYAIQSFGSTRSSGTLWISTTIDMSSYNGWIKIKYHKG